VRFSLELRPETLFLYNHCPHLLLTTPAQVRVGLTAYLLDVKVFVWQSQYSGDRYASGYVRASSRSGSVPLFLTP